MRTDFSALSSMAITGKFGLLILPCTSAAVRYMPGAPRPNSGNTPKRFCLSLVSTGKRSPSYGLTAHLANRLGSIIVLDSSGHFLTYFAQYSLFTRQTRL